MAQRETWFKLAMVGMVVVACFLALEGGLRLLSLNEQLYYRVFRNRVGRATGRYQHDPNLGWRLRPGYDQDVFYPHGVAHETINAEGWRDREREVERKPGTRRLAVLGCSRSYGYGATQEDIFSLRLENMLRAAGAAEAPPGERGADMLGAGERAGAGELAGAEVLNFAVNGFGIDQMLLNYVHYARRYKPDVVLLQLYEPGIMRATRSNAWGSEKPHFVLEGDALELRNHPVAEDLATSPATVLMKLSLVYRLAMNFMLRLEQLEQLERERAMVDTQPLNALLSALLKRFRAEVEADGGRFIVFVWGASADWLGRVARESGVETVNLDTQVDISAWKARGALDFPPPTGHWNALGHEFVATALHDYLSRPAP